MFEALSNILGTHPIIYGIFLFGACVAFSVRWLAEFRKTRLEIEKLQRENMRLADEVRRLRIPSQLVQPTLEQIQHIEQRRGLPLSVKALPSRLYLGPWVFLLIVLTLVGGQQVAVFRARQAIEADEQNFVMALTAQYDEENLHAEIIEGAIHYLEGAEAKLTPKSAEWARVQYALGVAYNKRLRGDHRDNLRRAQSYFEAALTVFTPDQEPSRWEASERAFATASETLGDYAPAKEAYERLVAFVEKTHGTESLEVAATLSDLGSVLNTAGDSTEAINMFRRSLEIRRRVLGPSNALTLETIETMRSLAEALRHEGKVKEAEEVEKEINRWWAEWFRKELEREPGE